jgi:RNA polymerase sigma-70 factor, ECF subfamily
VIKPGPAVPRRPGGVIVGLDDATLVARAQDGDIASVECLLARYQTAMYRLALRILGSPASAEDAVQEAFLAAWRQLPAFRGDAAFSTWLYRIVTNRALNAARAERRHRAVPLDSVEAVLVEPRPPPDTVATAASAREALAIAVGRLSPDQRACWVLRESDGLGYQEIATIIGITPDAVRGQIHRARRTLAASMKEWQ